MKAATSQKWDSCVSHGLDIAEIIPKTGLTICAGLEFNSNNMQVSAEVRLYDYQRESNFTTSQVIVCRVNPRSSRSPSRLTHIA